MIYSYESDRPYKLVDGKTYAVRFTDGSVEVLRWLVGSGWRRLNGEYITGEFVHSVVCAVKV